MGHSNNITDRDRGHLENLNYMTVESEELPECFSRTRAIVERCEIAHLGPDFDTFLCLR